MALVQSTLPQKNDKMPLAFDDSNVVAWDNLRVHACCPHCDEVHISDMDLGIGADESRSDDALLLAYSRRHYALCISKNQMFEIRFPVDFAADNLRARYEIDEQGGLFVLVGTAPVSTPGRKPDLIQDSKAFAILDRDAEDYPGVMTMSGYTHNHEFDHPDDVVTISGAFWTTEVFRLCEMIRHTPRDDPDWYQGRPGWFYASHAEKQAIVYFIWKHYLKQYTRGDARDNRLCALRGVEPPIQFLYVDLWVSKPVCKDCEAFISCVERYFDVEFKIYIDVTIRPGSGSCPLDSLAEGLGGLSVS